MFLIEVVKKLNSRKIHYAVVGGYAVALHGAVRGTVDVDLVLALSRENFVAAEKALKELGLRPRLPVTAEEIFSFRKEYIKNRNLVAWSFIDFKNPSRVVDIILTHDLEKMSKVQMKVVGENVPVLSKNYLIKMKKQSGRPQDLEDIRHLEALDE